MPKKSTSKNWKHKKRDRKKEAAHKKERGITLSSTDEAADVSETVGVEDLSSDAARVECGEHFVQEPTCSKGSNNEGQIENLLDLNPSPGSDQGNDDIGQDNPTYRPPECASVIETDESEVQAATEDTNVLPECKLHLEKFHVDHDTLVTASLTIEGFLPKHWTTYLDDGAIHVLYLSRKELKEVQRELIFYPGGKVALAVHGAELNIRDYFELPESVPLGSDTIKQFTDRCVKTINHTRNFEICAGHSDEEFRPMWKSIPNSKIDLNPYKEDRYSETLRSNKCSFLVPLRAWRCNNCTGLRKALNRRLASHEKDEPHPNTPNISLSDDQRLRKLGEQQQKIGALNRKLDRMEQKIQDLLSTEGVNLPEEDNAELLEILKDADLKKTERLFLQQQAKASSCKGPTGMRWHPTMIRFALSLYMKSPICYETARQSGMIKLPSQRTLYDYSHVNSAKEGIDDEAVLRNVKERVEKMEYPYQKYHVLICDEMHICQNLVFKKSTGQMIGYANLGEAEKDLASLQNFLMGSKLEKPELATKMLSFMVKGVSNNVKEVIASYSVSKLTADLLYSRTCEVINRCERNGICIALFVSDGYSTNRSFLAKNKCVKFTKSGLGYACVNKSAPDRLLYFMSDVAHLLKTIRNCFNSSRFQTGTKRCLEKGGEKLLWQSIIDLYKAKGDKDLRKAYKLTAQNVYPNSWSCMKVKYAAQVLSKTVALDLESMNWPGTTELVNFIRRVNDWFDSLNGAHSSHGDKTKNRKLDPYRRVDDPRFQEILGFLEYLSDWKEEVYSLHAIMEESNLREEDNDDFQYEGIDERPIENSLVPCQENFPPSKKILSEQTLEGIEISTMAFVHVVQFLLNEGTQFVNARVFSQDHLEQFFSKQRFRGGPTNNPNVQKYLQNCTNIHIQGQLGVVQKRGNTEDLSEGMQITHEKLPKLPRRKNL